MAGSVFFANSSARAGVFDAAKPEKTAEAAKSDSAPASTPTRKIAFTRGDTTWLCNPDGSGVKKLSDGNHPDFSPDGTKLALDKLDGVSKEGDMTIIPRYLAIIDLATGKTAKVGGETKDAMQPVWSPDGRQLLFIQFIGGKKDEMGKQALAVINPDGTNYRKITDPAAGAPEYYNPTWAPDGKSIYAQDTTNIVRLSLTGEVITKWNIEKLFNKGTMNSGGRVSVSPDGKTLLLDIDTDEENKRTDWEGPPPAVYTLEVESGKVARVTPKGTYAWGSTWAGPGEIFFTSSTEKIEPSLYRLSLAEAAKGKKLVLKNAELATVTK